MANSNKAVEEVKLKYENMVRSVASKHRMNADIGSMYSYVEGNESDKHIITKELRAVATTKSYRGITDDEASETNIQYMEFPSMKLGDNMVEIDTNIGFFPIAKGVHKGSQQFRDILEQELKNYCEYNNQEYTVIARRMVLNMIFLRWTFRNISDRANQVKKVIIKLIDRNQVAKIWEFDGKDIIDKYYSRLNTFDYTDNQVEEIVALVNDTFMGRRESSKFSVEGHFYALAKDIFPSQCFIDKNKSNNSNIANIGKILYTKDDMCALTSDKVNNGIRTIDTWYCGYDTNLEALPVNEYAPCRDKIMSFRKPSTNLSFWQYFEKIFKNNLEEDVSKHVNIVDFGEDMHYFVAVVVKGFVSTIKNEDKSDKNNKPNKNKTPEVADNN